MTVHENTFTFDGIGDLQVSLLVDSKVQVLMSG